jgi:CrcB protein
MKIILLIGTGSFIGGVSRYLLSQLVHTKSDFTFPLGTLIVNITGCFLIGLVFGLIEKNNLGHEWKFFLITGLLGGFTTFSAFSHEAISLYKNGEFYYAALYVLGSIILGLAATIIGKLITDN